MNLKTYRLKPSKTFMAIALAALLFLCGAIPIRLSFEYGFDRILSLVGFMPIVAGVTLIIAVFSTHRSITIEQDGLCFGRQKHPWTVVSVSGFYREDMNVPSSRSQRLEAMRKDFLELRVEYREQEKTYKIYRKAYSKYDEIVESIMSAVQQSDHNRLQSSSLSKDLYSLEDVLQRILA